MSEQHLPPRLQIVESDQNPDFELLPRLVGEQVKHLIPDDFNGKESIVLNGVVAKPEDSSVSRRLNVQLYNPEFQSGPFRVIAKFSYRDIAVREHDMEIFYLRYISDKFHVQKLKRITNTRKFIYEDCMPETVEKISSWLDGFVESSHLSLVEEDDI